MPVTDPFRSRISGLRAKLEATYATDPTVAAADAVRAYDYEFEESGDTHPFNYLSSTLSPKGLVVGARRASLKFKTRLIGNGNITGAATPNELEPLFAACGWPAVTTAEAPGGSGNGYVTVKRGASAGASTSAALSFNMDGQSVLMLGCRGTWTADFPRGAPAEVTWDFKGRYIDPATLTMPSHTYDSSVAVAVLGAGLWTLGAYVVPASKVTISAGNQIDEIGSLNVTDGVECFAIVGGDTTCTIDTLQVLETAYPWFANWKAGTTAALAGSVGSTNGYIVQIAAPAFQISGIKHKIEGGHRRYDVAAMLNETATGNDELTITFH